MQCRIICVEKRVCVLIQCCVYLCVCMLVCACLCVRSYMHFVCSCIKATYVVKLCLSSRSRQTQVELEQQMIGRNQSNREIISPTESIHEPSSHYHGIIKQYIHIISVLYTTCANFDEFLILRFCQLVCVCAYCLICCLSFSLSNFYVLWY